MDEAIVYPEEARSLSPNVPGPTRTNTSVALRNVTKARTGIGAHIGFYNQEWLHQVLGYRTPREVFEAGSVNTKVNTPEDREGGRLANERVVSLQEVGRP